MTKKREGLGVAMLMGAVITCFVLVTMHGCATPPALETVEQEYAQQAIYIGDAAQAVIDAQLGNFIDGVQAATFKATLQQALEALKAAHALQVGGNASKAEAQLKLAKALLDQVNALLPTVPRGTPPSTSRLEQVLTL